MGAHHHASPAHRWRLAVAFAITTAVPGTPAVPKLPSTDASRIAAYWAKLSSMPKYWAMKTAASVG